MIYIYSRVNQFFPYFILLFMEYLFSKFDIKNETNLILRPGTNFYMEYDRKIEFNIIKSIII